MSSGVVVVVVGIVFVASMVNVSELELWFDGVVIILKESRWCMKCYSIGV